MPHNKQHIDPEVARFRLAYPTFPGVKQCVTLLQQPHIQGGYREAVFAELAAHAHEALDELLTAFQNERNRVLRPTLLEIIAQAAAPIAFPLLAESLFDEETLRPWAAYGLYRLDSKEARRVLWEARSHNFTTEEETTKFQRMLDEVQHWK